MDGLEFLGAGWGDTFHYAQGIYWETTTTPVSKMGKVPDDSVVIICNLLFSMSLDQRCISTTSEAYTRSLAIRVSRTLFGMRSSEVTTENGKRTRGRL